MKKYLKWFIILIPVFLILLFILVAALIPNTAAKKEEIKLKEFKTKDGRVTLMASEKFKSKETGEYDIYLDKDKKQIVGGFTYTLSEYEEKTSKEVLDHQVNNFISTRQDMKLFKKERKIDLDDKVITIVEYSGKTEKSSDCVYIFSVIDFKQDPNYVVYINEVIIENNYETNIGEMTDILKSAKLN